MISVIVGSGLGWVARPCCCEVPPGEFGPAAVRGGGGIISFSLMMRPPRLLVFSTCSAMEIPCSCFPRPWPSCFKAKMHYCSILEDNYTYIPVALEGHSTLIMQLQLVNQWRKIKPYITIRSTDIQLKSITVSHDLGWIEVPQVTVFSRNIL